MGGAHSAGKFCSAMVSVKHSGLFATCGGVGDRRSPFTLPLLLFHSSRTQAEVAKLEVAIVGDK